MAETAFITKYALTAGIQEAELDHIDGDMAVVKWGGGLNGRAIFHKEGRDWHRTKGAAVARAIDMKADRLRSLRAQILKLERVSFEA